MYPAYMHTFKIHMQKPHAPCSHAPAVQISDVCTAAQQKVPVMLREAFEHAASRNAASYTLLEVVIAGGRLPSGSLLFIGCQGRHEQERHALIPVGGGVSQGLLSVLRQRPLQLCF